MSPFPPRKRPSAEHSLSMGSLLDISNTPESSLTNGGTAKISLCMLSVVEQKSKIDPATENMFISITAFFLLKLCREQDRTEEHVY